jgi:Tfp pilus assembly protein FimT
VRCAGQYADGWIVFTNRDRDGEFDSGSDEVLRVFQPVQAGYTVSNLTGTRAMRELITYLPDGSSRRNQTLLLCAPGPQAVESWSVVLNSTGRPRVSRGDGQCPAAGS